MKCGISSNQAGAMADSDNEGSELASLSDARIMAERVAGETLGDKPDIIWKGDGLRIEVTNDRGLMLFTVIVRRVDAPAGEKPR